MKLFLRSILFFALAGFAPFAFCQNETVWTNMGGTSFETASNWTDGVPTAGVFTFVFPGIEATSDGSNGFDFNPGASLNIVIDAADSHSAEALYIYSLTGTETESTTTGTVTLNFASGTTFTLGAGNGGGGLNLLVSGETLNYSGNLVSDNGDIDVGDSSIITGTATLNLSNGTVSMDSGTQTTFLVGSGTTGTVVQGTNSTVTTGELLTIGIDGGTGTYDLTGNSVLNIGTPNAPQSGSYLPGIGEGSGSTGTLNIVGSSVLNAMNPSTLFQLGTGGGSGTINQSGNSTVNLGGAGSSLFLGEMGGTGVYNLISGNLNISDLDVELGEGSGATGTINQSGGTLVASAVTAVDIGAGGAGTYRLSAGSATFGDGLNLGASGGSGTVTQSGGTLLVEHAVLAVGGTGHGTYNMQGGTATFDDGVTVTAKGSVNQSGGTFTIAGGTLDLGAAGGSYTLGGGALQLGNGALVGTAGQGVLNLAGGTLRITTPGAFSESLDSNLSGVSTIDASTTPGVTTVMLGGNLSGAGGITLAGRAGTTFTFGGTNTYLGPTTIASGTLDATGANIARSSSLAIGPTAILNLTLASGGLGYAGSLGGSGAFNLDFTTAGNAFVVAGPSDLTGPVTLGANGVRGTLQAYNGTFGNIGDNGTASGVTIGGAPLAAFPAGATIPSNGSVTIGNGTYTGLTRINSGFTLNANNLAGSVSNSGSLFSLSSGAVINDGSLGLLPGSAVGSTFAVAGDLNQSTGAGSLRVRVDGASVDSFTVATTADLFGKIVVSGVATATPTAHQIVTAGVLTTGALNTPGGLQATGTFLLNLRLAYGPDPASDLELIVSQNPIKGQTPNQQAVAASLNLHPTNPIFMAISNNPNLTLGDVPSILESLSPESLQYARNIAFENATFLVQRVNGFDAALRAGYGGLDTSGISVIAPGFDSGLGRSLGSLLAYNDSGFHPTAPNGVNYYPGGVGENAEMSPSSSASPAPISNPSSQVITDTPNPYLSRTNPSGPETPRLSEFIAGDAVLDELNQDQGAANAPSSKAHYTAGDVTAGVSFRMTSNLAAGVLFDYNHTDAKTDSSGSKTTLNSYSPGLFATYFDRGLYINGLFSFGYNNYSNTRNIGFLGETASSSPNGQQYVGDLDVGYDFHPARDWIAGPTLGVTYTHLDVDSFSESGAPLADLNVQDQNADSLRTRLGGHVIYQTAVGDVLLQPNLTAMWQHEFLDNSSGITSSFEDFSASPFTIQTAAPGRDSALIGVGLTATLSTSITLYLNYLADVGASDYFAQSVVAGLKGRF